MDITGEFSSITKQLLSAHKTIAWATCKKTRSSLKQIRFQEQPLQVFLDNKSLGAQLNASRSRQTEHYSTELQQAISMANTVASFPLSSKDRGLLCAAKILPTVLFGSEIAIPPKSQFGKLRSAITRAVWRKRFGRSPDMVSSLLHPIHRLDPLRAWAYWCLVQLRRMCKRRAD